MERYVDMASPLTGGKVKEINTVETHEFRKEKYSVHVRYYICEDTGERFTTTDQDTLLFNDLYSQYRIRHGIPFPDEIQAVRERYSLTCSCISKILGFGINQYALYEKGQMPSESNGKMISAIKDKAVMLSLLKDSKEEFPENEYSRLYGLISRADDAIASCTDNIQLLYQHTKRSIFNGFGQLDTGKLTEMVKFFVSRQKKTFPTKLNKEMFYADFYHYKLYGRSISGLTYRAVMFGPVPDRYATIYDNIDSLEKETVLSHDMESTVLKCDTYNPAVFSAHEIETLEKVFNTVSPMSTSKIIEKSHQEDAWINYHTGNNLIPYSESFTLKLI